MPYSGNALDPLIYQWIVQNVDEYAHILDIGAGAGKWGELLHHRFRNLDAVEIWEPFIHQFSLNRKYRYVYAADIRTFLIPPTVVLGIMGDVLEHLTVEEAREVLSRLPLAIIKVPYRYEQGEMFGNPYEEHHQPDLTREIMLERYPGIQLLGEQGILGAYLWVRKP